MLLLALTREVTHGRDSHTLVSIWSLTGISFIFAFARFYVKGYMAAKLRSDDYLIMLALSCIVTSCGLSTKAVDYGLGRHVGTVSQEDQIAVVKWIYLASCPSVMSLAIPKLAVITLLTRLLVPGKIHQWILWSLGAAVQIFFFAAVVMFLRTLAAKCPLLPNVSRSIRRFGYACLLGRVPSSTPYLAVYHSILLYHLQMPLGQKTAFSVAFGLEVFSGAAAIYKTAHIPALASPDFICLLKWTVIESRSIVIASSIPVPQPLMRLHFGFSILGRPLETWKRSYAGVVAFCGKKMATAIQRRVRGANNLDDLSELGEDVEAHGHRGDGSTDAHGCAPASPQTGDYHVTTEVVEGK
ncbi:uncharacterized protein PG986_012993 [Apiospora aurea]|uniref:Rhodopsin domain-containing protein n=1 Tax=Apiospora aurea TaxID=335848 RepID=A0ABR1Q1S9_9PEZI